MKAARTRTTSGRKRLLPNARRLAFGILCIVLLGGMPLVTSAQTLEWSPWTMDFGDVQLGTTEFRTLTLTNTDSVDPLAISSVEFTYNVFGQYSFETSQPLPAVLLPGGSMDVVFSFTPVEVSFQQADIMITNDSSNAPSLYYMLIGLGIPSDICFPLDSCGGLCVDLQTDLENCGSCGNACGPVANGTAICAAGQCAATCDEGYELVDSECEPIVVRTPLEMLQDLIVFFDASRTGGTLVGFGPGRSAENRADALRNMMEEAGDYLAAGFVAEAFGELNSAQLKCDGGYPFVLPPDFVAGEAAYEIHEGLIEIMEALKDARPDLNLTISEPNIRLRRR